MLYRIKQFFKGLTASDTGSPLVDKYLNPKERELFMTLPPHEKRHAIDTAKTLEKLNPSGNMDILLKAALLHDIGKAGRGIGLIKKSMLVLMNKFLPQVSRKMSSRFSMFDVYYTHNDIGAKMLKTIDTDEHVIMLVRHHQPWDDFYVEGMEFLKKADSLN